MYSVNYAVSPSPAGFHAVNVVLHALAAALVALVALRLGLKQWPAAAAGVLFAVHPIHVEAVANVAGRKDELAAIFVLLALLAHDSGRRIAACAALLAAMFSKESGAAGVLVLLAWDAIVWRRKPDRW